MRGERTTNCSVHFLDPYSILSPIICGQGSIPSPGAHEACLRARLKGIISRGGTQRDRIVERDPATSQIRSYNLQS